MPTAAQTDARSAPPTSRVLPRPVRDQPTTQAETRTGSMPAPPPSLEPALGGLVDRYA
jgi:hypothetical protein